jgi:hypothetical protein
MRTSTSVAAAVVLTACQTDYDFRTVAEYGAPRSGCEIRIEAGGTVRAGHDVSQEAAGVMALRPSFAPRNRVPVRLHLALRDGWVEVAGADGMPVRLGSGEEPLLSQTVREAGCSPVEVEVDELARAIEGVLRGPKGTQMQGQTKALSVRSIAFDR